MTSSLLLLCLTTNMGGQEQIPPPKQPPLSLTAPMVPACEVQPIPLCDFARSFKPAAGNYEVVFLHPVKCCPVSVCFCLPPGCPKVCLGKRVLVFDYGCQTVTIRFKILCGGVKVICN